MTKFCSCTPGNASNGWHEKRSDKCVAKEKASFVKAIQVARKLINKGK